MELFDDSKGLGVIAADDGSTYEFHCVEIAGGGRTISLGAAVVFATCAKFGRWEAFGIVQVDGP